MERYGDVPLEIQVGRRSNRLTYYREIADSVHDEIFRLAAGVATSKPRSSRLPARD